jgi:hypothetical protein
MKYLPILGATVAIVCVADVAVAKTPAEIEAIAVVNNKRLTGV